MLEIIFQSFAVLAAFVAAWLWYQSTKVPIPKTLGVGGWVEDDALERDNAEKRWARETGEKNRRAALVTAFSVGAQGAAILANMLNCP
ncbi:hypothetical protein [Roseinatronobacter sp.]|uniref:hypothetical protein n=1 Tax=Roseinatronobacter sp. TaxID=1945755 RepID=UPI003F700AC3